MTIEELIASSKMGVALSAWWLARSIPFQQEQAERIRAQAERLQIRRAKASAGGKAE